MPESAPDEHQGTPRPLGPRDALVGTLSDLRAIEQRLGTMYQRLLDVPVSKDTLDNVELGIEHLLADVATALHRITTARITAELAVRRAGG